MSFLRLVGPIGAMWVAADSTALAHTAYMRPSLFQLLEDEIVTVEAAFTSRYMFPDVAVRSDKFHVIRPDGTRDDIDRIETFTQATYLQERLTQPGTYRISSGDRLGRKSEYVRLSDGSYTPRLDENDQPIEVPAGAEIVSSQTETVSDVYVTRGPDLSALPVPSIGRLRLTPITHPNSWTVSTPPMLSVTFDGAPQPDLPVTLFRDGGHYQGQEVDRVKTTGENGDVSFPDLKPGAYVAMIRMQAIAPKGSDTDIRSYTTSLTFEVLPTE